MDLSHTISTNGCTYAESSVSSEDLKCEARIESTQRGLIGPILILLHAVEKLDW